MSEVTQSNRMGDPRTFRGLDLLRPETITDAEWARHAVVELDGRRLQPVAGQTQPSYDLPAAGGLLHIDLTAYQPWWRLAQGIVLVTVVFMALPFGNRRSRRSTS